ncbi:MAG TPA: S8 family serine peptidase [Terriglobales bacterium]|nr:S8 family serine peptidase [Terriglobales bacterium]
MNTKLTSKNLNSKFKRALMCLVLLAVPMFASQAEAQSRLIVRDSLGLPGLKLTCLLLNCKVGNSLGDPQGQLFVVTFPTILNPLTALLKLNVNVIGILDVEIDQTVTPYDSNASGMPSYLTDNTPTTYYGNTVWHGYLVQPGNQLVSTGFTQSSWNVTGSGITVAIIDTGVDVNHPALQGVLVNGYDFTRNVAGGSEDSDVNVTSNPADAQAGYVNQRTVAVLDQRTVAVLDGGNYSAFGHGTMTAGIVHLVAPQAKIMPLKAFSASGAGYESDVLRAIYYAVQNGAQVMNMSWDFTSNSNELATAVKYAQSKGVIAVASAGNDGKYEKVYPGALPGVINVASTSDQDVQSTFTNYGNPPVFMAAPGEGIMTLYPSGTYAAGWGTSFSTPFVAGTAALMLGKNGGCSSSKVASGLAHADAIFNPQLGWGRLDSYSAVKACHGIL